jgi:hypothetical protein
MLNPDGVILGNYRTGFAGQDLNRRFKQGQMLVPTVTNLMGMAMGLAKNYRERLIMYLDFHGHSINRNVFAYGPHYKLQDVIIITHIYCKIVKLLLMSYFA